MGKTEARKAALNKLLEKVIELVRMKETPRKYILIIFYRFFLDTGWFLFFFNNFLRSSTEIQGRSFCKEEQ
jgi:hypothetical protein